MKYAIWFSGVMSVVAAFIAPAFGIFWSWMNDKKCLGQPIIRDWKEIGFSRKVTIGAQDYWVYRLKGCFDEPKGWFSSLAAAEAAAHEEWDLKNWLERLEASRYQK